MRVATRVCSFAPYFNVPVSCIAAIAVAVAIAVATHDSHNIAAHSCQLTPCDPAKLAFVVDECDCRSQIGGALMSRLHGESILTQPSWVLQYSYLATSDLGAA